MTTIGHARAFRYAQPAATIAAKTKMSMNALVAAPLR